MIIIIQSDIFWTDPSQFCNDLDLDWTLGLSCQEGVVVHRLPELDYLLIFSVCLCEGPAMWRIGLKRCFFQPRAALSTLSHATKSWSHSRNVFGAMCVVGGLASYQQYTAHASWDGDNEDPDVETVYLKTPLSKEALYTQPSDQSRLKIFSGSANRDLALEVALKLNTQLGRVSCSTYNDGETRVELHDNVRGNDIYIIQPTCSPTADNMMELLFMISTFRRASAARITAVIPYFGYARQVSSTTTTSIPGG